MKTKFLLTTLLISITGLTCLSQQSDKLYDEIARMDSLYFSALNDCDLEGYASILSEDFELIHDQGVYVASKDEQMEEIGVFCGSEQRSRQHLRRELVEGSLMVYPMHVYGALQVCDHVFYLQLDDGTEKVVSIAKMTALWKLVDLIDREWKLTRVISYDLQPLAEVELSDATLDQYVGDYTLPDRRVSIEKEGKLLRVFDTVMGKISWTTQLYPQSENKFYQNYDNVVFEFLKEGSTVTTLNIYKSGELIEKAKRD